MLAVISILSFQASTGKVYYHVRLVLVANVGHLHLEFFFIISLYDLTTSRTFDSLTQCNFMNGVSTQKLRLVVCRQTYINAYTRATYTNAYILCVCV